MEAGVILIVIIIRVGFGVGTAAIASAKGRNATGWFFAGLFLDLIGIIIICCLSNLKEDESRRTAMLMEQRRLREQLRQEQLKAESYRQFTYSRLDAHDQALGIDTRNQPQLGAAPNQPQYLPAAPEDPAVAPRISKTYIKFRS